MAAAEVEAARAAQAEADVAQQSSSQAQQVKAEDYTNFVLKEVEIGTFKVADGCIADMHLHKLHPLDPLSPLPTTSVAFSGVKGGT